jgi:chromosome segregation ATPase
MSSRFFYILSGVATAVIAAVLATGLFVQLNTLVAKNDATVRSLADEHNRVSRLQADLTQTKQENDAQKAAYGELVRSKQAVEQDRDGWKDRAEKDEREEAAAARELESAKDAYEKSRTAFAALEGELKTVQAKLDETETSLRQTREALEKAERERSEAR